MLFGLFSSFLFSERVHKIPKPLASAFRNYISPRNNNMKELLLHSEHQLSGAKFVDFFGYRVPISYGEKTVEDEVNETQAYGSVFDSSYQKQLFVEGKDACSFLEELGVFDMKNLNVGQSKKINIYGSDSEELLVSKFKENEINFISNTPRFLNEAQKHLKNFEGEANVVVPKKSCILSFQGPKSAEALADLFEGNKIEKLQYMQCTEGETVVGVSPHLVIRNGNTKQNGYIVVLPDDTEAANLVYYVQQFTYDKMSWIGLAAQMRLRKEAGY